MIIRKFQETDLEPILQLFEDVVHSVAPKYYTPEQLKAWAPPGAQDKAVWLESLQANFTYVAEAEGQIIAFGDMTQTGYIDRLFVDKKYQGSGVARKIFQKLEEEARRLGLTELTIDASLIAMPVAKRQGFEVVKEDRKIYRGAEFHNFIMRKVLT
ncbi:MAG: GNAT family N-acetyltransferase [Verrucomicrobia bacterium]|nr:GNAT family N-acetyltransferase [Verrucomicrobiota bacterium]